MNHGAIVKMDQTPFIHHLQSPHLLDMLLLALLIIHKVGSLPNHNLHGGKYASNHILKKDAKVADKIGYRNGATKRCKI